jgi:hypothetical protein
LNRAVEPRKKKKVAISEKLQKSVHILHIFCKSCVKTAVLRMVSDLMRHLYLHNVQCNDKGVLHEKNLIMVNLAETCTVKPGSFKTL